jgi:predicted 2-oxoglutarate/Fe(II)-dependent dioxygenase YbiX
MRILKPALVQFLVGRHPYTLAVADVKKYPESFLARAIDEKWRGNEAPIEIHRDGEIFRFVSAFLVSDRLPSGQGGSELSADVVQAIKAEADFYNLPKLARECDKPHTDEDKIETYSTIRSYVESAKSWASFYYLEDNCVYPTKSSHLSPLVDALATVWAPFCVRGKISKRNDGSLNLFKSSTMSSLNIPELLEAAKESPFGRGTETVLDPTVRKSHEIAADKLNAETLEDLADILQCGVQRMVPNGKVELLPYKLVIYQDGGHFDAHRDTVRGDGHIGTLVLVLNSKYTGGELEITHNGRTEVVTGPYSWVAMYGDCLHKINPVTSGTRVSLIFDIINPAAQGEDNNQSSDKESDSDYCEESNDDDGRRFWEDEYFNLPSESDKIHAVPDATRQAILKGINQELDASESVVICLAHKYPLCQAVPEFLKGGDRALYKLLKDTYDAQVVACTVVYGWYDGENDHGVVAKLFTLFDPPAVPAAGAKASAARKDDSEDEVRCYRYLHGDRTLVPSLIYSVRIVCYTYVTCCRAMTARSRKRTTRAARTTLMRRRVAMTMQARRTGTRTRMRTMRL